MNSTTRKPKEGWQQQNCGNYMFIPTRGFAICLYTFIAVTNLVIGGILWLYSKDIIEYKEQYSCGLKTCKVQFDITSDIPEPIYLYYEIENYYQNHRIYVKSRSSQQLTGTVLSTSKLESCDPIIKVKDLDISDFGLKDNEPANPCGLIAKSYFQDTFKFVDGPEIKQSDIAWPSDLKGKYKNAEDWEKVQWTDVEDEHFIVWMRIAATSEFRKLWGKVDGKLDKGKYVVEIDEKMDYSDFDGKKYVVISNANTFGGKNTVLTYALFISGGLASIWTLIFIFYPFILGKK